MDIYYHFEEAEPFEIAGNNIEKVLIRVAKDENRKIEHINFIFCNDEYLLKINQEYLHHDYYTDIITFDNSEKKGIIESDIFISIDRIKENAFLNSVDFYQELFRVMIHGVLHLVGFNDKSPGDKKIMTEKENAYLSLL